MVVAFQCHYTLHFTGEPGETSLRETNILQESCSCVPSFTAHQQKTFASHHHEPVDSTNLQLYSASVLPDYISHMEKTAAAPVRDLPDPEEESCQTTKISMTNTKGKSW